MIKEALIKKLEGDIEVAKTDLRTFLASPIGVAEHIDYVDTAEKKLDLQPGRHLLKCQIGLLRV